MEQRARINEKLDVLRTTLKQVEKFTKELHEEGVVLNFTISSEKKTVEVSSASIFEISCKATINQEL